jgi:hypothetical protein
LEEYFHEFEAVDSSSSDLSLDRKDKEPQDKLETPEEETGMEFAKYY